MASSIPPNPPPNPPPQSRILAAELPRNRCEISPKVRIIAQRTQDRMFQRTGLFFNEATFQVPNTVQEAFENMHLGTSDLDKNDPRSTSDLSDLYLISWSNTQFFSAQMAGLGFRFISCNLRKKPGLKQPPPVEKWLRLERLPIPLARQPSAATRTTPSSSQTTSAPIQNTPARAPALPTPRVQNMPQPSTAPQPSQSLKRPQPPQPSSDRAHSPPSKTQRRPSDVRDPSQQRSSPQPPKRTVTSSSNKPPQDPSQSSVPVIIDLT